jgi:hypothetical protein
MRELNYLDLCRVIAHLPSDVRTLLAVNPGSLMIGGGFIRSTILGEKPNDIDIFGESKERLGEIAEAFCKVRPNSRKFKTDNAITVLSLGRTPVQFITRWTFYDMESLVKSFDFTIAMAAVYMKDERWVSCIHDNYYEHLAAKRLVYTAPVREEEAGGSLMRVRKFLGRGYNILAPDLAAVITRLINAVEPAKVKELGWEKVLTGLLREVDPLLPIDGIELVNEHETVTPQMIGETV